MSWHLAAPCGCAQCGKPIKPRADRKTDLCRGCWSVKSLDLHRPRSTQEQRREAMRRRYLPGQLEAARRKVAMLEREAERLGVEVPR